VTARTCTRFARHCEDAGWICASSDAFGENPSPTDGDAATLFLEAVRANANVDGGRPVISGYESSAEAACRLALLMPNVFAGALLESCGLAPWRDVGALARNDVAFFLFTRHEDPAREAMMTMKDEMQRKGLHVTYEEIAGGRHAMERDELDPAFAWLATIRG
jgi:predicted esterase